MEDHGKLTDHTVSQGERFRLRLSGTSWNRCCSLSRHALILPQAILHQVAQRVPEGRNSLETKEKRFDYVGKLSTFTMRGLQPVFIDETGPQLFGEVV